MHTEFHGTLYIKFAIIIYVRVCVSNVFWNTVIVRADNFEYAFDLLSVFYSIDGPKPMDIVCMYKKWS